jgi:hypothetical protein
MRSALELAIATLENRRLLSASVYSLVNAGRHEPPVTAAINGRFLPQGGLTGFVVQNGSGIHCVNPA